MKKLALTLSLLISGANLTAGEKVASPDGGIIVDFNLSPSGRPTYSVSFQGEEIVRPSGLGFLLKDATPMIDGFRVDSITRASVDDIWKPVWGENTEIADSYRSMTVHMTQPLSSGEARRLDVEFRAYDDGAALRYIFPSQAASELVIADELTEMAMGGDYTAWWIPGDYDTQEYEYTRSHLSEIRAHSDKRHMANVSQSIFSPTGVQTSLMLKTPSGKYLNLHEAALVDYPAMHLNLNDSTMTFVSWLTPSPDGTKAVVKTPFRTPWRVVMASEKATGILASNIIYNLNDPCAIDDTSWIKPVKYMGVWWEMITGKSTWSYCDAENFDLATFDYSKAVPHGRHGANNENVRRYIDFASENGMDQLLIEGWNIGWEDWFGKQKDYVFDFVTPYPDFDLKYLNDYAHSKGVKLMMHHETSGSVRNYERHMENAYKFMNENGYNAVKSGYVGNIIPRGEYHYSQWLNNHYLYAVKEAAKHKIMVNAHEASRPTGLARTYPNLIGNESARGTEYQAMGGNDKWHTSILPFTRLQGGPMDYTPGIFEFDLSTFTPGNNSKIASTIPGQLALYVTMYSPLQMAADLPEHYEKHLDAFQFIKDVPVEWERSVYLEAEPMEYITVARKDKNSDEWYVGSTAGTADRKSTISLSFLDPGRKYEATIYAEAPDANTVDGQTRYTITKKTVTSKSKLTLGALAGGGYAISLKPLK